MYYRDKNVNTNWYDMWVEELEEGMPPEIILDDIARMACGIELGASDVCQTYAKHIRTHIEAAFLLGKAVGGV